MEINQRFSIVQHFVIITSTNRIIADFYVNNSLVYAFLIILNRFICKVMSYTYI